MVKSVLLVTSNGWGLGHLVRQLAIAGRLPREVRCTIFTLSQAAAVAARPDLEYAPSYTQPWLAKGEWNGGYLRDRLVAIAEEVSADVIVYDGVVPYVGLLEALSLLPAERIWMRRGLWSERARTTPLRASSWFDLILEPADLGASHDRGPTANRADAVRVGVVTDANPATAFNREMAARRLGLDPNRPALLINIGSSAVDDLDLVAEVAQRFPAWQLVTTKDELGRTRDVGDVHVLSGVFPLHPYLKAIDLAVSSVGYNAAHELVAMEVPTIFVPAPTTTDDQYARAAAIAEAGAGWAVTDSKAASLAIELARVLAADAERAEVRANCGRLRERWTDGAAEAADQIVDPPHRPRRENWLQWCLVVLRARLEQAAGTRLRGRQRTHHEDFLLSRELTRDQLSGELPFEHLLPRGSDAYAARRREIARKWLVE